MGSFYFVLPEPLILKDNYEVAITNLCFPNHWDKYHVDFVFIHSDIIYNEIAFNENCFQMTYLRVKKTVNVEYIEKNFYNPVYDNPHYLPVNKNRLSSINISIRDLQGRPIKFSDLFSVAIITLHFRKKNE